MLTRLWISTGLLLASVSLAEAQSDPKAHRDAFMEGVVKAALPTQQMRAFPELGDQRQFACIPKVGAAFRSEVYARAVPAWVGGSPFKLDAGYIGLRLQCELGGHHGLQEPTAMMHANAAQVSVNEHTPGRFSLELSCAPTNPATKCQSAASTVAFDFPDKAAADKLAKALTTLIDMVRQDDEQQAAQERTYTAKSKAATDRCAKATIDYVGGPWMRSGEYRAEAANKVSYHAKLINGRESPNFGQLCVTGHVEKFLCVHTIRYDGEAPDGAVFAIVTGFDEASLDEKSVRHKITY